MEVIAIDSLQFALSGRCPYAQTQYENGLARRRMALPGAAVCWFSCKIQLVVLKYFVKRIWSYVDVS